VRRNWAANEARDKFAPRTIDIDIVLFDGEFVNDYNWAMAYIIVPLAEIEPEYRNLKTGESIKEIATRLRQKVWLETRWGILG